MELHELCNKYLSADGGGSLAVGGPYSRQIQEAFRDEDYSTSLIATIFWQAFVYSDAFLSVVEKAGLNVTDYASCLLDGEGSRRSKPLQGSNSLFVVSHGEKGDSLSFDLVVFDRNLSGHDPIAIRQVEVELGEAVKGWARFVRNAASNDRRITGIQPPDSPGTENIDIIFNSGAFAAMEAYKAQRFGVLFVGTPELIATAGSVVSPSPPMKVTLKPGDPPIGTIGVAARNGKGDFGVTAALHAFLPDSHLDLMAALGAISEKGREVWVDDHKGYVISTDLITDSCFIGVPVISPLTGRAVKPPLGDKPPKGHQLATFEASSPGGGVITTTVTGWSLYLPFIVPTIQCAILTTAQTVPNDSGTTLIDENDNVLGFSYLRSRSDQMTDFSMWIWAESVRLAHDIYW